MSGEGGVGQTSLVRAQQQALDVCTVHCWRACRYAGCVVQRDHQRTSCPLCVCACPCRNSHPQKRSEVYNNVKRAEAASTVLSFFHRQSQESNCCMLCKRDFHSDQELGE